MTRLAFSFVLLLLVAVMAPVQNASAAAPAVDPYESDVAYYSDPIEPFNRAVFTFNKYFDMVILRPLAYGYKNYLPGFAQTGIHNFLVNLLSPVTLLNELLQGDLHGADIVTRRFFVNTILGWGGFVDAAEMHGLNPIPREDFGQTLGVWGVGAGPYLVLPIIGPSNLRDLTGRIVDVVVDPWNLWATNVDENWIPITRGAITAIDTRAILMEPYDDIMKNSVDPYSSFRSIYSQNRTYAIRDRIYQEGGAMDVYTMTEGRNK